MNETGVIGVGAMGRGFVVRLLEAGHPVTVFDVSEESRRWAALRGASAVESPREVAERAEVIVLSLPDTPEILEAVSGGTGLEAGLRSGSIVVVASTVAPGTPVELERRLAPLGVGVVDAPVSGGPARAAAGTLVLMCGGSPEMVDACRPVLEHLGHVVHVGPVGHGEIAKLANNLMGSVIILGISEGLALAAKAGADLDRICEAVGRGSGGSWILSEWIPETVLRADYERRFSTELMVKDLRLIESLAAELGVPITACELAGERFGRMVDAGHGHLDFSYLVALEAEAAGTSVSTAAARSGP
jgi:3-hydroxyisobutyrate dehydrogenase-like beta-hydroxyacid dehydrogenase